jgi:transcriptional regulator with XRE-family HTH domain
VTPAVDLRRARINRGLSLAAAARQMRVSRDTLDRAERGDTRPRAETAFRIASFYDLQVTDVWPLEAVA